MLEKEELLNGELISQDDPVGNSNQLYFYRVKIYSQE